MGTPVNLGELVLGSRKADTQTFDFAEPPLALSLGDSGDESVADLNQPVALSSCAPNRMLAAMACAVTPPGQRTIIDDSTTAITAFLRPRPVRELPGQGAKTAATLAEYGLHTVGDVTDIPQLTLQRLLGVRASRTLHEHAQGSDTTTSTPPRPRRRRASAASTASPATNSSRLPTGAPFSPSPTTSAPASGAPARSPRA